GRHQRPARVAGERTQSAMALGILRAERTHLPELAPRADARFCARVRARSRADAPEAARPFEVLLEAGGRGLPENYRSTPMAPSRTCLGPRDIARWCPAREKTCSPATCALGPIHRSSPLCWQTIA